MNNTLNLTKILFKNSLNKNTNKEKNIKSKIAMAGLILFLIIYIAGCFGYISYQLINSLKTINQEQIFLSLCIVAAVGITLFKAIFTVLNVLYFSKDVEFLLPLPLKPINIVLSKFNVMLITEYITEFITFVVPFAVYGYMMQMGAIFYLKSIIIFLFLPIIPLLISVLIIVFIMRFTKFLNNKDIVQYLTVFFTIAIVIGVQFINTSSNEITDFMVANKMLEINGMTEIFSNYFFTIKQATNAIISNEILESITNIGLLIFESVIAYLVVGWIVSKFYIKTAIAVTSSGIKKKKIKKEKFASKSASLAYIGKEIKILFRNSVFFLQCVLPSLLFPIIFSIPIFRAITETSAEEVMALKQSLVQSAETPIGFGIILVIINFLFLFNFISVTAVSRDGENASFMKYIPIALHKQCKYKVMPSVLLNMFPLVYVIVLIKYIAPQIVWGTIIEIFVIGILCNLLISYLSLCIDLVRPKLHWVSEYTVVKQNMNMLYSSMLSFVVMGVVLGICAYCANIHIATAVIATVSIIVLIIYEMFLRKYSRQIFKKVC